MAYGILKCDNITFDNGGSDQNVTVSGLYRATTSGVTVSGTIAAGTVSGVTVIGSTTVSGATVTGTTANFTSGNFSNLISAAATMSGALIMANQQQVRFREAVGNGVNHIALQAPAIVSADQTITLPDQTGTVVTTGDNGSVSSTMLATNLTISAAAGSAAAPSIAFTGDLNTGIYSPGADQVAIVTNGQQGLIVGADGSVSVTRGGLTLNATGGEGGQLTLSNPTNTGGVYTFDALSATEARLFTINDSTNLAIGQLIGTGGIVKFLTGAAERMRIDSSGNVGIGTGTPAYRLDVQGGIQRIINQGSVSGLNIGVGTTTNQFAVLNLAGDTTYTDYGLRIVRGDQGANSSSVIDHRGTGSLVLSATDAGTISFNTNGAQRMSIGSDGIAQITSPSTSQTLLASATNATFSSAVFLPITTRAAGTNCFYIYGVANDTVTFIVYNNGNVVNTNNSYGSLSDIKLKENIVDASSQWDDIKALQVRKYNFKEETGHQTHTQIGLVAQEAELISPGLVTEAFDRDEEGNELETTTKSINYSVLYMKAVKALQEAMERIEALEARIAALEA
jgi:hypothetical protein